MFEKEKYLKYKDVINILDNISYFYNIPFNYKETEPITRGSYDFEKNIINIGVHDLHKQNIFNLKKEVSYENFTTLLITVMHELRHKEQYEKNYKKEHDLYNQYMALDHIGSIIFSDYYHEKHNYYRMLHEIDAEKNGVLNAYIYLQKMIGLDENTAESLIIGAVNNKSLNYYDEKGDYYIKNYYIKPEKEYISLEDIIDDFDTAFEKAKEYPRNIYIEMLDTADKGFQDFCILNGKIFEKLMWEKTGLKQAEIIAYICFYTDPLLKNNYPILKEYDLSEEKLFGGKLKIITNNINYDQLRVQINEEHKKTDNNIENNKEDKEI